MIDRRPSGGWIARLAALFFPERCVCCGAPVGPGEGFCGSCGAQLARVRGEICPRCGREKDDCGCAGAPFAFDRCVAPFYYEGVVKKGVLRFKFQNKAGGARVFASEAAQTVRKEYGGAGFDFVACVPMSARERQSRGFCPSEIFAKELARALGLPYRCALVKVAETRPQRSCGEHERWGNVSGAFAARGDCGGKTVLLADDIITTGATLSACAAALRNAGAKNVSCSVIACVIERKVVKIHKKDTNFIVKEGNVPSDSAFH